jgi:hypothetical protein
MPSRISTHLAEQARYLLPKYFLFTSAMAFLHSACVYGSTGRAAGAEIDRRFGGFGLVAACTCDEYLGFVGLVEGVEVVEEQITVAD